MRTSPREHIEAGLMEATHPTVARAASPARAIWFGASGRRLFGWFHPAASPRCAVVICSPMGNESTGWHRAARHWAEALASTGTTVLRFDYDGTGDSFGDQHDPGRLRAWIDSVADAVAFLRARSGAAKVVVAGMRIGATLAIAAAGEDGNIDGLILWAPFASGRAFLREGRAFTRLMAPDVDATSRQDGATIEQFGGLALTAETVQALAAWDPLVQAPVLELPVLLIPREATTGDASIVQRLTLAGARVEREEHAGYASVITDAHQATIPNDVIAGSVAWLARHFNAGESRELGPIPSATLDQEEVTSHDVTERAITIGEHRLCGILSSPTRVTPRRTGIILVNSGAVYRVGPNRLYVTLARRWASLGYRVLRLDLGGLGDSPVPPDGEENRPYPRHAVRDVAAGIARLRADGVERIVVGGLCSGAHTTFHAGLELDGIDGVMMINPIVFYWKPSDPVDVSAWRVYVEARHYRESARQWSSWRKLLGGGVDLAYVGRVAWRRAADILRARGSALRRRVRPPGAEEENAARDLQRILDRGASMLLLFSDGDPGHDYLTMHYSVELARLKRVQRFLWRVIDAADHTFTTLEARGRAGDLLTEHLLAHHP